MDKRLSRRTLVASAGALGGAAVAAKIAPASAQSADSGIEVNVLPSALKSDPVLEITQSPPFWSGLKFKEGEAIDNNVVTKFLEEQLGVRYKYTWDYDSADAVLQKWSLALASGDIPEMMSCVPQNIYSRLLSADRLEDITDVWESKASDLTKQKLEYPDNVIWRYVTSNGRLYGMPFANSLAANDMVCWIRKDWLEKVGMEAPTTLDELATVGKAFVDQGLAKMGLAVANDSLNGTVTYLGSLDPVYGAYGVMPTYWVKGDDGSLVYGSIQPGVKDALALIQKWYADGVIEKEFFTIGPGGNQGVLSRVVSGQAGIIFGPYWFSAYAVSTKDLDPNADMGFIALPTGPNGTAGRSSTKAYYGQVAFKKGIDQAKLEAVINHLNWIFERFDQQFDTHDYFKIGGRYLFEGYDYAIQDGAAVPGDFPTWSLEGGAGDPVFRYPRGLADWGEMISKVNAKDPSERNVLESMFVANPIDILSVDAYKLVVDTNDIAIVNEFTGTATPTMTNDGATLAKLEVETFTKIITGQASLDDFDDFVSNWKKQGGDKMTEEVNEWFSSL